MKSLYRFEELPGFSQLHADLTSNLSQAARWFPVAGVEQEFLLARARQDGPAGGKIPDAFRELMLEHKTGNGDSPQRRRYMARIEEGHCMVVGAVTGAAFLGGPMAVLYKALTAARMAEVLDARGLAVVPLIWIDESFGMLPSCLLDMNNAARMLPAESADDSGDTAGDLKDGHAGSLLEWLKQNLPETDFAGQILASLAESYRSRDTGAGLACFLSDMLNDFGVLVLAIPGNDHSLPIGDCISRMRSILIDTRPQVNAVRSELGKLGGGDGEALAEFDAVLTDSRALERQLLPFAALPWLARICSPQEVAAHACLRPLLRAGGFSDPFLIPSASMTIVEPKVGKVLEKYELELADFFSGEQHAQERALTRLERLQLSRHFEIAESRIGELLGSLAGVLESEDAAVRKVIGEIREKVLYQLLKLKGKQELSWRRQRDIAKQQIDKALHYLLPLGRRQEELFNVNYFLVRHGRAFIQAVYGQTEPVVRGHKLYPHAHEK